MPSISQAMYLLWNMLVDTLEVEGTFVACSGLCGPGRQIAQVSQACMREHCIWVSTVFLRRFAVCTQALSVACYGHAFPCVFVYSKSLL